RHPISHPGPAAPPPHPPPPERVHVETGTVQIELPGGGQQDAAVAAAQVDQVLTGPRPGHGQHDADHVLGRRAPDAAAEAGEKQRCRQRQQRACRQQQRPPPVEDQGFPSSSSWEIISSWLTVTNTYPWSRSPWMMRGSALRVLERSPCLEPTRSPLSCSSRMSPGCTRRRMLRAMSAGASSSPDRLLSENRMTCWPVSAVTASVAWL